MICLFHLWQHTMLLPRWIHSYSTCIIHQLAVVLVFIESLLAYKQNLQCWVLIVWSSITKWKWKFNLTSDMHRIENTLIHARLVLCVLTGMFSHSFQYTSCSTKILSMYRKWSLTNPNVEFIRVVRRHTKVLKQPAKQHQTHACSIGLVSNQQRRWRQRNESIV